MSNFLLAVSLLVFIVIFKAHGEDQWSRSCEIDVSRRVDCGGHIGGPVTAESCVRRGCCWKPLHHGSKEPWCFMPKELGRCKMNDRVACPSNTKYTCEGNGCCWVPSSQLGPWCYYGSYRETLTCDVNTNDRTPCEGSSEERCRFNKCCWKPDRNVAEESWCYRPRYFGPPRTSTIDNSLKLSSKPTVNTSSFEIFSTTPKPRQTLPPTKPSTRLSKTNSVPVVEQTTRLEGTHFTPKKSSAPEKLTTSPERKNSAPVKRTTMPRKTKLFPKQTSGPVQRTTLLENTKMLPDRTKTADKRTTLMSGNTKKLAKQTILISRMNSILKQTSVQVKPTKMS